MIENNAIKPATWFWVVAVIALLWNLAGLFVFVTQVFASEATMAAMEEADRQMLETRPSWATAAFGLGVIGGTLGCVLLLMRKKFATTMFLLSLLGIVVQQIHGFFMSDFIELYGATAIFMPLIVLIIAVLLWMMARSATNKGWLS